MTFFADHSPHSYSPTRGLEILNIGWLDEGQAFPTGPTSKPFQNALLELCQHPIIRHRGFHTCWFCRTMLHDKYAGNGQIRVLAKNGIWFAAPTLVHHYVTLHDYLPPVDFIEAVLSPVAVGTNHGWFDMD